MFGGIQKEFLQLLISSYASNAKYHSYVLLQLQK